MPTFGYRKHKTIKGKQMHPCYNILHELTPDHNQTVDRILVDSLNSFIMSTETF